MPCTIRNAARRYSRMDLRGTRLCYRDVGRGPTLLLVHGWALDLDMWEPQLAALSNRFRIIAVDRRGFGRSSGNTSLPRDVADLRTLCLRLGLRNIAVVGMSPGPRIALRLASSRSLSVRCLVLDGPPAPPRSARDPGTEDPPLTHYREVVARTGMNAFRREWRRHPLLKLHQHGREARLLLRRMLARYPGTDLRHRSVMAPTRIVPELIRTPTLVLCGERDAQYRVAAAVQLVQRLPRVEFRRVAGAGHLSNLDSPRDYNRLLDAFLRRHPGPGGRRP